MTELRKNIIVADHVSVEFHTGDEVVTPLNDVSFSLNEGSFNIIYGPSGSGKSTLLNVLTGLQRPTKGKVVFDEKEVYQLKPNDLAQFRANDIGFIYQTNYWIKSLNVIENVAVPLYFLGYSRKKAAERALEVLQNVDMANYAKKYPVLLSGGEQQRIAIARALASDPKFIIADEPTGSLDSKTGDFIMSLLEECRRDYARTVILVTHNMEYLPLADKLLHIEDGQVKETMEGDIKATADKLLLEMRERIHNLARLKEHGGK